MYCTSCGEVIEPESISNDEEFCNDCYQMFANIEEDIVKDEEDNESSEEEVL